MDWGYSAGSDRIRILFNLHIENQLVRLIVSLPRDACTGDLPLRLTVTDSTTFTEKVVEVLFRGP